MSIDPTPPDQVPIKKDISSNIVNNRRFDSYDGCVFLSTGRDKQLNDIVTGLRLRHYADAGSSSSQFQKRLGRMEGRANL